MLYVHLLQLIIERHSIHNKREAVPEADGAHGQRPSSPPARRRLQRLSMGTPTIELDGGTRDSDNLVVVVHARIECCMCVLDLEHLLSVRV